MPNLKEKKYAIALEMATSLGFDSLDDFDTIVNKDNFKRSLALFYYNGCSNFELNQIYQTETYAVSTPNMTKYHLSLSDMKLVHYVAC